MLPCNLHLVLLGNFISQGWATRPPPHLSLLLKPPPGEVEGDATGGGASGLQMTPRGETCAGSRLCEVRE